MYNHKEIKKRWIDYWEENKISEFNEKKLKYISKILNWLHIKINLHFNNEFHSNFKKYEIYWINFGINIWTEFSWKRPWLIFKSKKYLRWKDIVVLPITSQKKDKKYWDLDILLNLDKINWLTYNSVIKIEHIKSISKSRIWDYIWKINDENLQKVIENKIVKMLLK